MPGIFVHKAGHCLGAHHDRYTFGKAGALDDPTFNYWYCLPSSTFASVMAYEENCPPPGREIIFYFSNPDVTYKDVPNGDEHSNNARTITEGRDKQVRR